jgi:cellulose synthase/poly-beta-1,6-N-acetylglucosamine synthase-like glycosyltransferase
MKTAYYIGSFHYSLGQKMQHEVTILIPNYKTLDLTKLCLRLLRKYTDLNQAKVIVIDNDSQDESLAYLRSLNWITLLERKAISSESPAGAHSAALDLALEQVSTPFVLSIHTDTLVKHPKWLPFLLNQIKTSPKIAGVGSWKLETKPFLKRFFKNIEFKAQYFYYRLIGKNQHGLQGVGKNYYYLRSHCALYRTDLLKKYHLNFSLSGMNAGKALHKKLGDLGYNMIFLPSEILLQYVEHINHATTVLNPSLSTREKSLIKGRKRIEKSLQRLNAKEILQDSSLD